MLSAEDNKQKPSGTNCSPKNNTAKISESETVSKVSFLSIVKKFSVAVVIIISIGSIFSPIKTIVLQIVMLLTGLWALIFGKIWLINDKDTIKAPTSRVIGALLLSAAPLSLISSILVVNKYGYTDNAMTYGTLIEAGIFSVLLVSASLLSG